MGILSCAFKSNHRKPIEANAADLFHIHAMEYSSEEDLCQALNQDIIYDSDVSLTIHHPSFRELALLLGMTDAKFIKNIFSCLVMSLVSPNAVCFNRHPIGK